MDTAPVVSLDALAPHLAEQRRAFEVVVTVPREDNGGPLIPRLLPPEVLGCWSATTVTVSATVVASRPSRTFAAVEALVPELAGAIGAVVTVRDADTSPADPAAKVPAVATKRVAFIRPLSASLVNMGRGAWISGAPSRIPDAMP